MKRSLFITIVVLLMAALFVSCNSDKAVEDQLFEVTIDGGARGLSATGTVSIDVDNLYWYYTATKTSGLFRTGETDGLTPVKISENLPAKGLSAASLGSFSKGGWNFCFYGYAEADPTTAPVFLQEDLAQTISGTTALQLTLERGAAVLDASVSFAGITWKIPATDANLIGTLTLEVSSTGMDTVEYGADPWNATTGVASFTGSYALSGTGDKTLTFSVFNTYTTANGTTLKEKVGEEQITLTVISGIQYTVVNTGDGISLFEDDNPQPVTIGTITVPQSEIKGFTAESTGAAVVNAAGAKVTFPESALTTTTEHTLSVSTTPRATAEENYQIAGSTAVAAIDIKLDNASATFNDLVEIEVTIEAGLPDESVSVQFKNGDTYSSTFTHGANTLNYKKSYDPSNGKLIIQTNHFSEYVAVIDCVAKIGDKAYGSVAAAIAAVPKTGIETVVTLMKNYEETDFIAVNGNRNVVLDLNEKTLGLTKFTYIYNGELTIKNGTLNTGSNLWIDGQKTAASGMKSVLTVASDAKLVGDYCIILENYSTTDPAYDATIDVYGKLDGMIWVMGNIVEGNCVINIHDGAVINSAEVGIALNGMATLNVEEGASITGVETAIEVRSGILNITGGTFKSTGTAFTCDPNGNGTTTKGAAIAIAQHTTKKDIKVTISGGTFEGIRALNESNPQENDPAPQVDLTISGGTFKSTAETDPIAISITDYANTTITEGIRVTNGAVLPAPVALAGGVYYISLADAIAAAPAGSTVKILANVQLAAPITITKALTIEGDGHVILSQQSIYTQADVTFKNIIYQNPTNASNNASMIYGQNGTKVLVLENCVFANPQWEVVQFTSKDQEKLIVKGCTFTAANVAGASTEQYGNAANQAIRYLHIQPSTADNVTGMEIEITSNRFENCDKVKDSIFGFYYIEGTIKIGGNIFADWAADDVVEGYAAKLSIHWPENESLKEVAKWTGAVATYNIYEAE